MELLKEYTKFMVLSILLGLIFTCLIGLLLAYTNINDNMMGTLIFISTFISIFIGSMLLNRKFKKKGYLYGMIFGLIYFLLIFTFSSLAFSTFNITTTAFIYLLMSVTSGIIGGIIGVNI